MIKSIQLHKLFGRFNYNISMKSGGVTIITGPNGFGKSTILRIINALNSENIEFFMDLDFTSVSLFPESVVFWRSSVFSRTAESLAYAMLTMIRVPLLRKYCITIIRAWK